MSQQSIKESDEPFDCKRLGKVICELLGLSVGDTVEIKRDRLDCKRLMVIRIPKSVHDGQDQGCLVLEAVHDEGSIPMQALLPLSASRDRRPTGPFGGLFGPPFRTCNRTSAKGRRVSFVAIREFE